MVGYNGKNAKYDGKNFPSKNDKTSIIVMKLGLHVVETPNPWFPSDNLVYNQKIKSLCMPEN